GNEPPASKSTSNGNKYDEMNMGAYKLNKKTTDVPTNRIVKEWIKTTSLPSPSARIQAFLAVQIILESEKSLENKIYLLRSFRTSVPSSA
ncbi:hypothetical protein L9F63_021066, partial [Diploptera punctata]